MIPLGYAAVSDFLLLLHLGLPHRWAIFRVLVSVVVVEFLPSLSADLFVRLLRRSQQRRDPLEEQNEKARRLLLVRAEDMEVAATRERKGHSEVIPMGFLGDVVWTQGGKLFRIVKFRSTVVDAGDGGPQITSAGDPRITQFGALLRRLELDELPQLWNVLKGEMSLVGPRPELREYVASYTPQQRQVLTVRPGMTAVASISYRYEEELLCQCSDPEGFYRETILPHKLVLNLQYIERMSFPYDLYLIFRTLTLLCISAAARKVQLK